MWPWPDIATLGIQKPRGSAAALSNSVPDWVRLGEVERLPSGYQREPLRTPVGANGPGPVEVGARPRNAVATSGPPESSEAFCTTHPLEPWKLLVNMLAPTYSALASTPILS